MRMSIPDGIAACAIVTAAPLIFRPARPTKVPRDDCRSRARPAKYVRAYPKGQKNDFRGGEAIAEAVQRPTMSRTARKLPHGLDL